MTSGRYTAYHIYQGLSFPEAQKAATWPYKLPEYQCPHSQRGYLFQFDNMVERNHFDAANTTCCDQPVMNFANKPQFSERSTPMTPQNCGARASVTQCPNLDLYVSDPELTMCGSGTTKTSQVRIKCPALCPELAATAGTGTIHGTYGEFAKKGRDQGDILLLEYTPYHEIVHGYYERCSGSGFFKESFCGGHTVSYSVQAGLNNPGGCGCDCCGVNGKFSPPVMHVTAPASVTGSSGTVTVSSTISGSGACSGGQISGTYSGYGGSAAVTWGNTTQYHSDGTTRFITRYPAYVNSALGSTCCGGTVNWTGYDGCGGSGQAQTTVQRAVPGSTLTPASGYQYLEGTSVTVYGSGACPEMPQADLDLTTSCLTNNQFALQSGTGYVRRSLSGTLRFTATHACSGCCGKGEIWVDFNNGCSGQYQAHYAVRRNTGGGSGYTMKCVRVLISGQWRWKIYTATYSCTGSEGTWQSGAVPFNDLTSCIQALDSPTDMDVSGQCYQFVPAGGCCWYWNNGLTDSGFQAYVFQASGTQCCQIGTTNGGWSISGQSNCCPN